MSTPPLDIDGVPERLRILRAESGDPSYAEIARRVMAQRSAKGLDAVVSRATVYDCFREGRKRFNIDLVLAIVRALARDEATMNAWAGALASIGRGKAAASVVHVTDVQPEIAGPFVGRTHETAHLVEQLTARWVHAMPGAGKTTLALHAAREAVASGAVDGVILAELRGHSPAGPPADPEAVVRAALRLLGDKSKALPATSARKLLRDRLKAGRMLLVLDDAASLEQVRGIIPDPSGIPVIVTSRIVPRTSRFETLELPLFAPYESLALLDAVAGRAAIERDPASAAELLRLTEHQPLAVSLTAARVAARPHWTLAEHLDLARTRREGLRLEEPVVRSLDLTFRSLPDSARTLLRAVAAHPVGLLDRDSIHAIAGDDVPDPDADLRVLEQHSLIVRGATGRVEMHELVRVFAAELGLELDPPSRRRAAAMRLRRSVVARAWSAHRARSRARKSLPRAARSMIDSTPIAETEADAFFTDSADLLLHVALTADDESESRSGPATVNLIAESIGDTFHRAGRADDAVTLHREALRTARARGDGAGELRALVDLGGMLMLVGRVNEAESVLSRIDRTDAGWHDEAPLICNALGAALLAQGRVGEARALLEEGVAAASDLDDPWREGLLWNSVALLHLRTGDLRRCQEALRRSIDLSRHCGDHGGAARGRVNLAKLLHDLGDNAGAETEGRRALSEMEDLEFVPGIAAAYSNLSAAVCALGRFDESATLAERGLAVARDAGSTQAESELLRTLGRARLGEERIEVARSQFERSLALAESLGDLIYVAECHEGLGDCAQAGGDEAQARRMWERALEGYASAGSPQAQSMRDKIAGGRASVASGKSPSSAVR